MTEAEVRGDVKPEEVTEAEPVEEDSDEDADDSEEPVGEYPDEDADDSEEEAVFPVEEYLDEYGADSEEEAVLALGSGEDTAAAAESEKLVMTEGDDEEKTMAMVKESGGEDTEMEPEESVKEDVELEGAEEKQEEGVRKEDDLKFLEEGDTMDDKNKIPEEHEVSSDEGAQEGSNKDVSAGQLIADGDVQNDELGPSLLGLGQVSVENAKDFQIFVGRLPADCSEEDITMVFSQFGEIESIKVIKQPARKKHKCMAFVRYMKVESAKKALTEFKEGVEVKGERIRLSASRSNITLYLGNICMSWTKDQVINTLKSIGIEEFEMSLPNDPDTGGRNRGFAFLKFATHDSAEAAFEQLKKHCAPSGIDGNAKESARTSSEPSDELTKVKTVYLDGIPLSWDETKIEECCEGYGMIHKVRLIKRKKKIISFIEFSSRMSALACVEGIKHANIGGDVKLAASLARPPRKMQLDKGAEAGGEVNGGTTCTDTYKSEKKNDQNNDVLVKKNSLHKLPKTDVTASKLISQDEVEPQTPNPSKGKRKAGKRKDTSVKERPSKKAQKNNNVLSRSSSRTRHGGYTRLAYAGGSAGYMNYSSGQRYATSNQSCYNVGATSRSKPNARDLEPHAGYIPPAKRLPADRAQITYVYDQPRAVPSNIHQINVPPYAREIADPQPAYAVYTSNPRYQAGYGHTYLTPPGEYNPQRRYY